MSIDIERLQVLRAVAREGGFSRAARRIGKSQPAVSQAVAALEEDLGERLLLRLGREVRPTAAGRLLLEHAERALASLERARAEVAALSTLASGELSIATSDTNACYVLPPVLAAFRARHPGVELRLSNRPSPAAEAQVLAREVDLGFVTLPAGDGRLAAERLVRRRDVAILAPGHRLAGRARLPLAALAEEPLLLLDRGARSRAGLDARLRERGLEPRIAMELASIEVVKRLVALGFGLAVVPEVAVAAEVASGALVARPVAGLGAPRELGAVTVAGAPVSRAAEVFLGLARELL